MIEGGFDEKSTYCGCTAMEGGEWYDVDGVIGDGKGRAMVVDGVL